MSVSKLQFWHSGLIMSQQTKAGARYLVGKRQPVEDKSLIKAFKVKVHNLCPLQLLYFVLCTIGLVISVLVVAFTGHHYSQTSSFSCEQVGEDCVCMLDHNDPIARTFTYEEVSDCEVITGTLTLYFLLQIVLNLVQAIVCAVGAFIMWKDRYQVFFAGLQIGSPSSQQWQKV